ncbi:MAG: protein translocase subunit SecF [Deltaproteobacteria bacterium]|nr:protein translocase subunit SecF [Deltaproteobacteria bacterium]
MEIIRPGIKIDFMGKRRYAFPLSGILIVIGILSLIMHGGPNYGIDFAGGTLAQVRFSQPVDLDEIRDALKDVELGKCVIQRFGAEGKGEYLIRLERDSSDLAGLSSLVNEALAKKFGEKDFEIRRTEMVGPKVGKDLRSKGIKAIIFSLIGILIYISWRFEFRFAVGAVVALAHDVMITVGILSLTNKEFSLPVLAALLTIVGYSLNDTIVVYDRIRENMRRMRKETHENVVNLSVNETLSRTILTSVTTLIVIVILFLRGGGVIHGFAFALLIGIIVGTYSSIFVASPVVLFWEQKFPKKGQKRRR